MDTTINTLSLCSGVGALDLGIKRVLPIRTICYVEREAFCIEVLAHQMEKGELDTAPIWTNLTTFDGEPWRDVMDCIIAGFPCQPFSVAGKRRGPEDERWLWPHIYRIIREIGPSLVFLENVPGLRTRGLQRILEDFAEIGLDVEWVCVRASDVGAPHRRDRIFVLAYPDSGYLRKQSWWGSWKNRPDTEISHWPTYREQIQHEWEPSRAKPRLGRNTNGYACRVDRLRAIGNAVVPAQAALALRLLLERRMI